MKFILGIILGICLSISFLYFNNAAAHDTNKVPSYRYKHITEAVIYNPTIWSAKLLVKCDWDGFQWRNIKTLSLKAKRKVSIIVGNGSRCQIWPSLW